jgi:Zn finger protein HypA/HybF involved in hydrogenase expression
MAVRVDTAAEQLRLRWYCRDCQREAERALSDAYPWQCPRCQTVNRDAEMLCAEMQAEQRREADR